MKTYVLTGERSTYFKNKHVVPGHPIQVQDEDVQEFEKVFKDRIAVKKKKIEVKADLRNSKEPYDPNDPGTIPAHLDTTENETNDEKKDPSPKSEISNKDSPDKADDEADLEDDVADIENETDEDPLDEDFDPGVDDDAVGPKKGTGKPGKGKGKGDKDKK